MRAVKIVHANTMGNHSCMRIHSSEIFLFNIADMFCVTIAFELHILEGAKTVVPLRTISGRNPHKNNKQFRGTNRLSSHGGIVFGPSYSVNSVLLQPTTNRSLA